MLDTTIERALVFLLGAIIVVITLVSAIRTFVVPRSQRDRISRWVFLATRKLFSPWTNLKRPYKERDRAMAFYAPFSLLVAAGYTAMYWAVGAPTIGTAFTDSGSSLLTLGFAPINTLPAKMLAFSEAAIGLILIALLIAYLPAMYAAFARREAAVSMLEVRAGSPPSAAEAIMRYNRIHGFERFGDLWATWETWFVELEESHTSLAALSFFRSPQPERSWVTAAGAVLDTASLVNAAVDTPHDPRADLCIRAGYLALRRIADFFQLRYDPHPSRGDPISISRAEFDAVCDQLAAANVPLKPDREQAWEDFAGWRVNYDVVLLALARLTMAPPAPWSSDRAYAYQSN
jgi:hypothetical protein